MGTRKGKRKNEKVKTAGDRLAVPFSFFLFSVFPFPLVRPEQLHELVVQAENQEGRRPLADEQRLMVAAKHLQRGAGRDRADRQPQEQVTRELGRLLLDGPCDDAFFLFGRGVRAHDLLLGGNETDISAVPTSGTADV